MKIELTAQQKRDKAAFRDFVVEQIIPHANRFDEEQRLPGELVKRMADKRYWGAILPVESGGLGLDMITFGLLNEEIGRGCSSVRSVLTVHSMVGQAILRWGSRLQKERWIPGMASGDVIAGFALTEPNVGSDAKSIETVARLSGDSYLLTGHKKWITGGQIAGLFLVFAHCEGRPSAFLVERDSPGLSIIPVFGMLGVRACMLAELHLEGCRIPKENLLGRVGFGVSHVAASALVNGRYSVAWGCVGIAQACLEACRQYTSERMQFGTLIKDHQLVQQMMAEMITNIKAARLLCYQAGYLNDIGSPGALMETFIAKYFASTTATKAAINAVQIHGANGCSSEYPVQRYMRDAKIMEIIEGSTQIQQITIASYGYQEDAPSTFSRRGLIRKDSKV